MNETRSPKLFMGLSLTLGACSMLTNVLAFSTPYWLQLWPRVGDSTFRNLGLWQVCIAGYRNPKDLWGKVFYGCWWIFAREYDILRKDGILVPRKNLYSITPTITTTKIKIIYFDIYIYIYSMVSGCSNICLFRFYN
jgi:hypothetical protein